MTQSRRPWPIQGTLPRSVQRGTARAIRRLHIRDVRRSRRESAPAPAGAVPACPPQTQTLQPLRRTTVFASKWAAPKAPEGFEIASKRGCPRSGPRGSVQARAAVRSTPFKPAKRSSGLRCCSCEHPELRQSNACTPAALEHLRRPALAALLPAGRGPEGFYLRVVLHSNALRAERGTGYCSGNLEGFDPVLSLQT